MLIPFGKLARLAGALSADLLGDDAAVICGDSLQIMKRMPDGCVDLLFADPPYFLSNGGTSVKSGRRVKVDKGAWDTSAGVDADHAFHRAWLAEAQRITKRSGTLWVSGTHHAIFSIGFAMQSLGFHVLNAVTWCKPNASPNVGCRAFTHATEVVVWAAPRREKPLLHTFNDHDMREACDGKQMLDWWIMPTTPDRERTGHPTQKPEGLLDRIILASSKPGDVVFDPFLGSGTTGAMAIALRRRFLGVELEPGYARVAARRIARAVR